MIYKCDYRNFGKYVAEMLKKFIETNDIDIAEWKVDQMYECVEYNTGVRYDSVEDPSYAGKEPFYLNVSFKDDPRSPTWKQFSCAYFVYGDFEKDPDSYDSFFLTTR